MNLRYILYRARFRLREWFPGSFPIHVDIELAGKCQLACVMCPFGDSGDGTGSFDASMQGMMPRELAERALREAYKGGALSVKLNFRGEPGLSPHLVDMVKLAKKLGYVDIMLNTNLTAFSTRRLTELVEAGLTTLIVSVDGATKATYESIRIKGNFEKLVENLEYLQSIKNQWHWSSNKDGSRYDHMPPLKNPKVRIQMTVQNRNQHEKQMMVNRFWHLCDELNFNPVRADNSGERKKCPQPSQRLVIMWDGRVGACCSNWQNEAVIGRFPEQSLKEIWDSPEHQRLLYFAADPNRGGPCKGCLVGGSYK